jgi:two-component system phosphate regulon response regulator PhoB
MIALEALPSAPNTMLGHVLVVEDEEIIRETIALALAEEGYSVITAEDGSSALKFIKDWQRGRSQNV